VLEPELAQGPLDARCGRAPHAGARHVAGHDPRICFRGYGDLTGEVLMW
jgi:hypothetical protein